MLFFWPNKLFHYYSNNLSNWGKSKISSIKDCNWFLTWKSGTKSLNWPMNESVTTYTSCWIYRYIICFGATCRSRDDPGTKIGQTGFYSDSEEDDVILSNTYGHQPLPLFRYAYAWVIVLRFGAPLQQADFSSGCPSDHGWSKMPVCGVEQRMGKKLQKQQKTNKPTKGVSESE